MSVAQPPAGFQLAQIEAIRAIACSRAAKRVAPSNILTESFFLEISLSGKATNERKELKSPPPLRKEKKLSLDNLLMSRAMRSEEELRAETRGTRCWLSARELSRAEAKLEAHSPPTAAPANSSCAQSAPMANLYNSCTFIASQLLSSFFQRLDDSFALEFTWATKSC